MQIGYKDFCEESGCKYYQRIKELEESSKFTPNFIEFTIKIIKTQCQSCPNPRLEYLRWLKEKAED